LPDGEDPDDFVRKRGKAAFESALAGAVPLSEFLLAELTARHPPTTSEGRAALVAATRPFLAQISAPVLAAILRKRLAQLSGLPEEELRGLLAVPGEASVRSPPARGPGIRPPVRRPPSLVRQLIRGLLLLPELSRSLPFPVPDDRTPESAALGALVHYCSEAQGPLGTAGILQVFAESPHAHLFASILAAAEDDPLDDLAVEAELREGIERWWQQARREGRPVPAMAAGSLPAAESRRIAMLDQAFGRSADPHLAVPDSPDGHTSEGPSVI
ncbi:MAG TPA: hypothetical protein VMU08_04970, partial [Rhizomicrobium sp.]|nr:hypothetical protein [Rhizomicrobium sp.]